MPVFSYAIDAVDWPVDDPRHAEIFVSLSRMRSELRIPDDDTGDDELIRQIVTDTVNDVANDVNVPIIMRPKTVTLKTNPRSAFVKISDIFAFLLSRINLATSDMSAHAGIFNESYDVGNYESITTREGITIQKNEGNWDVPGSVIRATYERGLDSNDLRTGALRQMVILRTRAAYEGREWVPDSLRSAYERLLESVIYYDYVK